MELMEDLVSDSSASYIEFERTSPWNDTSHKPCC